MTINDDGKLYVLVQSGMYLWTEPRQAQVLEITTQRIRVQISRDTSVDFRRVDGRCWGVTEGVSPYYLDVDELEALEGWALENGTPVPSSHGQIARVWYADGRHTKRR